MLWNIPMAIIKMRHQVLNAFLLSFNILWCERHCSIHSLPDMVALR